MNVYWILKVIGTIFLGIVGFCALAGYYYVDTRNLYREPSNRWWAGLLAMGLPMISGLSVIMVLLIWNPLARSVFWPLVFLSAFVSFLLGQSITSPYKLADWWIEFGKWYQQRKSRRR